MSGERTRESGVPRGTDRVSGPERARGPLAGRSGALERMDGNEQLYLDVCRVFLRSWRGKLERLRAGLAGGNHAAATLEAHSLRGNCAMLGADWGGERARRVEDALRAGDADRARAGLAELESALADLAPALENHVRDAEE